MAPPRAKNAPDKDGFVSVGYQPGPKDCRCPQCSKKPRFRDGRHKGFCFDPERGGGFCPSHDCSFKCQANTKRFGSVPKPKDAGPSVRTAAGWKGQADQALAAENKKQKEQIKQLQKEAAASKKDAKAAQSPNASTTDADDQPAGSAAKPGAAVAK